MEFSASVFVSFPFFPVLTGRHGNEEESRPTPSSSVYLKQSAVIHAASLLVAGCFSESTSAIKQNDIKASILEMC